MNKGRRKELSGLTEKLEAIKEKLESLLEEEEEYRDNMPESLQSSERYSLAEAACDAMQEVIDQIDEALSGLETARE